MNIKIKSPTFPESVADGTIANWLKKEGETVNQDEVIAEIETDKVVLEVLAQADGEIIKILKAEGDTVASNEIIGEFNELDSVNSKKQESTKDETLDNKDTHKSDTEANESENNLNKTGPAAKKILSEKNINPKDVKASGKGNRITKADLVSHEVSLKNLT